NACKALTEQDAIYFERLAQVLARYHTKKAKLRSLRTESKAVCALDANGALVFPLSCDYAIWNERAAGRVGEIAALAQGEGDIKGIAVWVDGKTSDRATQELKNRKIDLVTCVLDKGRSSDRKRLGADIGLKSNSPGSALRCKFLP